MELIENLWIKNKTETFEPYKFKNYITFKDESLKNKNNTLDDIEKFIQLFLDYLDEELKQLKDMNDSQKYININIDTNKLRSGNGNDNIKNIGATYLKIYSEESIISKLFFGLMKISCECLTCKYNKTYDEKFKFISFSLNDILNNDNNTISLDDCFKISFENEIYNEIKDCYCDKCKKVTKCKIKSQIFQLPNILIIILKRDKDSIVDVELKYSDKIRIKQLNNNNNKSEFDYDLYGVTICINNSELKPTFIASCKNYKNNKWYIYEDREYKEVNDFQKEVLDYKFPYVLFYKKLNDS